jgi:hypothetical protein
MQWISSDGHWRVDLIHLSLTGTNEDGEWLRVKHYGYLVGRARGWDGVGPLGVGVGVGVGVDVSDLRESLARLIGPASGVSYAHGVERVAA